MDGPASLLRISWLLNSSSDSEEDILLVFDFTPVSASGRGEVLGESCSGTFPVGWSREGLGFGTFPVGTGGQVGRGEQSMLKYFGC